MTGEYQVFGGQTDYGDYSATNTVYVDNLTSFNFTFNPNSPDTLTVWRNFIFTTAYPSGPDITGAPYEMGIGGCSDTGLIGVNLGIEGSGDTVGVLDGTSTITSPLMLTSYASSGPWTEYAVGCNADTIAPPSIGESNLAVWPTYDGWLACGRANPALTITSIGNSASCDPFDSETLIDSAALGGDTTRGSLTVNSKAQAMAMLIKSAADIAVGGDQISDLLYFNYQDNGSTITVPSWTAYNFSGAIPGYFCCGANFFYQSTYYGPMQILINDSGDVAFPVVVVPLPVPNPVPLSGWWRFRPGHAILYMATTPPPAHSRWYAATTTAQMRLCSSTLPPLSRPTSLLP